MAIHLTRLGHVVTLLPRTMEEALEMTDHRENRAFFPGYPLDPNLQIAVELKPALLEAEVVLLACPSKFLRSVCQEVKAALTDARRVKLFITLCKGLEEKTNLLPSQILQEILPGYFHGALSGPTFAGEVAEGKPTAIVFTSPEHDPYVLEVQKALSNESLRVYTSDDVTGVELGGCLKNVYAIAAGICDGLKLGDNAKASLVTRALPEMVRLGTALGGQRETFFGLSGLGDLILTCHGPWSRNRTFGQKITEGESIASLIEEKNMTVEGYRTAACLRQLCREKGLEAPILEEVHAVLYEKKTPREAIQSLMSRELKAERV